ncbi:MAG: hypothetical protein M1828_007324 [Chrysothrix sp. TS-e1954]|nr:MAG: hypothetical protein M1828_007324 [Chrysothrix sp. TS-e1954]
MAPANIPTSFLVLSDTHNVDVDEFATAFHPLPKVDVAIHCGDLTQCGGLSSYRKALRLLTSIDAELRLVIPGNHDLELDGAYWRTHLDEGDEAEEHDEALRFWKTDALEAGVTYLEEGTHSFELENGARLVLYASPYQPEFNDMAFNYAHDEDRVNAEDDPGLLPGSSSTIPTGVDIMVTHGPPKGILDKCQHGNVGCPHLMKAVERARPLLHCFGHIHEGYGVSQILWKDKGAASTPQDVHILDRANGPRIVEPSLAKGRQTLFVNASVMTENYTPSNAPWVVTLILPGLNSSV